MEEYLAMIKMFAGNFAPLGFALCEGQLLSISTNTALFSLLGTMYGGDGQTTFGLPDLRGRVPVGTGQGLGLSGIVEGQLSGVNTVTILTSQMPAHTHAAQVAVTPPINADSANTDSPEGAYPATSNAQIYNTTVGSGQFAGSFVAQVSIGIAGGSQPLDITNPYLGMNYIICTEGIFPSRN